jgi:thiol:disulfide interchange protein DsbD
MLNDHINALNRAYAIIDTNEVLLNSPVGYTPDKNEYLRWLNCGLNTFYKK